jgi:thiol-disulfide isomerase/thioredoxin
MCVRVGQKLDNFALYNLNGQPWEFRRDRGGRLVLLDFWYSTCGPCLQAIPQLVDLQRKYGSYGLEVIGIAYEKGPTPTQVQKVRQVRGRYGINYTTLLGGGGPDPCPVRTQLEVARFPTLVLLDETGQIVWRNEGLSERAHYDLEMEIRRRLGIRNP